MPLEFLALPPTTAFRKIEEDLKSLDPGLSLAPYKAMTPKRLHRAIRDLKERRESSILEQTYGVWLKSPEFARARLLEDALVHLYEHKAERQRSERLVPGYCYYSRVKQFGPKLTGYKAFYVEGREPRWQPFTENIAIAKAKTVMSFGEAEDFARIYVELANGTNGLLDEVSVEHLTETTLGALVEIEEYCDQRWTGPWPWELPAPYKLRTIIEDNREMRKTAITEMQAQFRALIRRLDEDEMDKYEVITQMSEIGDKIERMIQEIGRVMGEGLMALKTNATVSMGDEAAQMIDQNLGDSLNKAAEVLTDLLTGVKRTTEALEKGDMSGAQLGGDMGGPSMGGEPGGDMGGPGDLGDMGPEGDTASSLADVELGGGDDTERLKKEA